MHFVEESHSFDTWQSVCQSLSLYTTSQHFDLVTYNDELGVFCCTRDVWQLTNHVELTTGATYRAFSTCQQATNSTTL